MAAITVIALIFSILLTITSVAASSMAIQAYTENPNYNPYSNPQFKVNNTVFLWSNIAFSFLVTVLCIAGIYFNGA